MQKIVIIGAGASGLMTAICSKTKYNEVLLLERNSEVGKKALETAGVKASNYDRESSTVKINTNGRVCITLKASNSGDFSSVKTTTATSATCS